MRGKKQAAAANRRAAAAVDASAAAREQRNQREREWAEERATLQAEIARLRGDMLRLAADEAAAMIARVQADADARVADALGTPRRILDHIGAHGALRIRGMSEWLRLGELCHLPLTEVLTRLGQGDAWTRDMRRRPNHIHQRADEIIAARDARTGHVRDAGDEWPEGMTAIGEVFRGEAP